MRVPGKESLARDEINTSVICDVRTMLTTVTKRPSMKSPEISMTPDKVPGKVMTPDKVPSTRLRVRVAEGYQTLRITRHCTKFFKIKIKLAPCMLKITTVWKVQVKPARLNYLHKHKSKITNHTNQKSQRKIKDPGKVPG
jgi:hypothetical protein